MEDIEYYGIPIYNFPYDEEEDDAETIRDNMELRVSFFRPTLSTQHYFDRATRLSCPSPSLARKKKLKSKESRFAQGSTLGVSQRSTILTTRTSFDSVVQSLGAFPLHVCFSTIYVFQVALE